MQARERYSYTKTRKQPNRSMGRGRVFVSPKTKYVYNPMINLPAKFWGNLGILAIIFILIWLIFYSAIFRLKEVIIEGNRLVSADDIAETINSDDNIFRINTDEIEEKIIKINPIIKDVAIYRGIPNALKIVVLEKMPIGVWVSGDNYYLLDDEGYIDKKINSNDYLDLMKIYDQKKISVKIGDQVVSPDFIKFSQSVSSEFFNYTNLELNKFEVQETTFDLYVYTGAGFFVKFDTTRSANKQLTDLKNIIIEHREEIKEYVDVRINGWAYYK
jgi:hypothetical protein